MIDGFIDTQETLPVPEIGLKEINALFTNSHILLEAEILLGTQRMDYDQLSQVITQKFGEITDANILNVINEYVRLSQHVHEAIGLLEAEAVASGGTVEGVLVKRMDPERVNQNQHCPRGTVTISTDYPLVLEAYTTSDEDYNLLTRNPRGPKAGGYEQGGNYKQEVNIHLPQTNKVVKFPFLALRSLSDSNAVEGIRRHERNHARNHAFITASPIMGFDGIDEAIDPKTNILWGGIEPFNQYEVIKQLIDLGATDLDRAINSVDFSNLIIFVLSDIKNELVADMGDPLKTIASHITLIKNFSGYDPLRYSLHSPTAFKAAYYPIYHQVLDLKTAGVVELQNIYRDDFGIRTDHNMWHKRQKILPIIFAQIPLHEWDAWTNEGSLFIKEAKSHQQLFRRFTLIEDSSYLTREWTRTDEVNNFFEQVNKLKEQYAEMVDENSDKFIHENIQEFVLKLDQLEALKSEEVSRRLEYGKSYLLIEEDLQYLEMEMDTIDPERYDFASDQEELEQLRKKLDHSLYESGDYTNLFDQINLYVKKIWDKINSLDNE